MRSAVIDERRKHSRISAGFHVAFYLDDDIVTTTTEDISFGGMRILAPRPMSHPGFLDFVITFKGEPIETKGRVVYVTRDKEHAGIQFKQALHDGPGTSPESLRSVGFDPGYISEKIQM